MAGDFETTVERFETEDGRLVMVGRMGVWDARTYIGPRELIKIFGKLFHPKIILYLLRLPFLSLSDRPNKPVAQGDER